MIYLPLKRGNGLNIEFYSNQIYALRKDENVMKIDYELIGQRLKKARQEKGLSQVYLSEILDISEVYLSRVEKGRTKISLTRLIQICEILDVSISEIIEAVSATPKEYIYKDFIDILEQCTPEKRKLIYHMAILVCNVKN